MCMLVKTPLLFNASVLMGSICANGFAVHCSNNTTDMFVRSAAFGLRRAAASMAMRAEAQSVGM